jgi:hypothetical protein
MPTDWIGKDVEWSGHGLFSGNVSTFAWVTEVIHKKPYDSQSLGQDLNTGPYEFDM